jgi:hypothetical protein
MREVREEGGKKHPSKHGGIKTGEGCYATA